jgi:hypothetical protein
LLKESCVIGHVRPTRYCRSFICVNCHRIGHDGIVADDHWTADLSFIPYFGSPADESMTRYNNGTQNFCGIGDPSAVTKLCLRGDPTAEGACRYPLFWDGAGGSKVVQCFATMSDR